MTKSVDVHVKTVYQFVNSFSQYFVKTLLFSSFTELLCPWYGAYLQVLSDALLSIVSLCIVSLFYCGGMCNKLLNKNEKYSHLS